MALNHFELTPEQTTIIEHLRALVDLSEQEAQAIIISGGIQALRWYVATILYTTRPLSVSDVAEQVGVSRGACIEWFHQHGVAPFSLAEEAERVNHGLDVWLEKELHSL